MYGSGAIRTSQTVFQRRQHQKFKPCSKNPHVILALQKSGRFLPPFHSAVKDDTLNKAAGNFSGPQQKPGGRIEAFKQSYLKTSRKRLWKTTSATVCKKLSRMPCAKAEQEILKPLIPNTIPTLPGILHHRVNESSTGRHRKAFSV